MEIRVFSDFKSASEAAAELVSQRLQSKPNFVLGLATGETPLLLYRNLIERCRRGKRDFSQLTTFNLDEYLGLAPIHPQSYRFFMNRNLFDHLDVPREQTHILDGSASDPQAACADFEKAIVESSGIDLQVLGVGSNGHIAFNEPGSAFDSRTRVVDLSDDTIRANSDGRFFKDHREVPHQALSMGLGTIMETREIILLAKGKLKADAVQRAVEGPVTENVPASILQRHPQCTFFLDEEAASKLTKQMLSDSSH